MRERRINRKLLWTIWGKVARREAIGAPATHEWSEFDCVNGHTEEHSLEARCLSANADRQSAYRQPIAVELNPPKRAIRSLPHHPAAGRYEPSRKLRRGVAIARLLVAALARSVRARQPSGLESCARTMPAAQRAFHLDH